MHDIPSYDTHVSNDHMVNYRPFRAFIYGVRYFFAEIYDI